MKLFVVLAVVAVAAGADYYSASSLPSSFSGDSRLLKQIPILSYSASSDNSGNYQFASESGDGTRMSESGAQRLFDKESGATKSGSYSWTSPEGKTFSLSYVADETGFHPVGDHLPKSPPIPEEIAKVLPLLPKLKDAELYGSYGEKPAAPLSFSSYSAPASDYSSYSSRPAVRPPTFLVAPPAPPAPEDLLVPVLGVQRSLEGPLETHVRTDSFTIDSDASGSKVRIGSA